jgi:tRNA threonylcarbamoyl adenosine modification protein YeaZ
MLIDLGHSSLRRLDGMRLLSICTSAAKASVYATTFRNQGQLADGALVFQEHGRESASMIFRMIDQALEQANLSDFDLLTFDRGPGAFTGVRIGCGVAQGLGFGKAIPVLGVNALAAQAFHMATSSTQPSCHEQVPSRLYGIAVDARMGEVYCAVYRFSSDQSVEHSIVLGPTVCKAEQAAMLFENLRRGLKNAQMLVGGNGFNQEGVHQSLFEWATSQLSTNVAIDFALDLDAVKIARFAIPMLESKLQNCPSNASCLKSLLDIYPAALAAPEYVRNTVALDKIQQAQLRLERAVR